jgi:uncharacterized cupredoxin-like copper-binding protein
MVPAGFRSILAPTIESESDRTPEWKETVMERRVVDRIPRLGRRLSALVALAALTAVAATGSALASSAQTQAQVQRVQHVKLVIKSDEQHGKKGPDGKWHDAFLPANFTVHKGARVVVTVLNYDDMPHSFDAPGLHVNAIIMMAMHGKPSRTTFTFTAARKGSFAWHCDPSCDPWSMAHWGFMKGRVKVV